MTGGSNKKMNFVGNLINKTGNRIPESRSDSIKMNKAITIVVNVSPILHRAWSRSDVTSTNGHLVYRAITPSKTEALILKANFVEYHV